MKKYWNRLLSWWGAINQRVLPSSILVSNDAPEVAEPAAIAIAPQESKRGLKRNIESTANEIIDLFSRAKRDVMPMSRGTYVNGHDDLWGCDFHYIDDLAENMEGADRFYLLDKPEEQAAAMWPVDVAFIARKEKAFFMGRVSSAFLADLRGKITMALPKPVVFSYGMLSAEPGGKWWAENAICAARNGRWVDIGNTTITQRGATIVKRTNTDTEGLHNSISVGMAAALTNRYSWHVAFGGTGVGPRLLLPTNPGGCLALFRDREKEIVAGLRAALRHWVRNHYRNEDTSYADLTYVRDHLRGKTAFSWRGLECEILVSEYDLEKNDFFKQQAREWRTQRKHNRVRIRTKDRRAS